ncbi:MAG TPA: hypothetical protein VNT22_07245, partial [Baekduia sp.]|nr:hypothetical protein [Baekduia sp.]
ETSFDALRAGDLTTFLQAAPSYGGSLILRAPFVYASELIGGGSLAAFRAAAIPCLLAGVLLGVHLFSKVPGRSKWLVLMLAAANPITLRALEIGHPEELLGGVFCVGAVLLALADRPAWAGLFLGLAFANKAWAVVAIGPVLLALDHGRIRMLAVAAAAVAVILTPLILEGPSVTAGTKAAATTTGAIFQPWQLFWFLGSHGEPVYGLYGLKENYRAAPDWIAPFARPVIGLMWIPITALFWRLKPKRTDALGLLSLLLLLRCVLDPWNAVYYELPFLLALLAWEVYSGRRAPLLTLAAMALVWISFQTAPNHVSPDLQALSYLAWAIPAIGVLTLRLFLPPRFKALRSATIEFARGRIPTLARSASA